MNRRHVLGMAGAALAALLAVGAGAVESNAKAAKPSCACCGDACECSVCTCDESVKDCDCCGASACCPSTAKAKVAVNH